MEVECKCQEWQDSFPQIVGAQSLAWAHGIVYTGAVMRICPWCGERLEEKQPEAAQEDTDVND